MTIKELLATIDTKEYADIEVYEPMFNNDDTRSYAFATDFIKAVDEDEQNREVIHYSLMDEEDYNNSICGNTGLKADFDEWFDDKNAKILCVLVKN